MPGAKRDASLMVELPPDAPLWAVANEARHWSAADLAPLKRNPSALPKLMRVPTGRQRRLVPDEAATPQIPSRPVLDAQDLEARLEGALKELLAMASAGITSVPLTSDAFPPRLARITNPPLVLYVLGTVVAFDRCIAVSGTRTPSQWGIRTAERLGRRLANAGWLVTSGLARGIDTWAHQGALSAPGGRTVAVSALPLDRVYPADNIDLAREIADRGALVSEHALSQGTGRVEFLRRNRIISGLSFAHFIVETSGEGGTWAQAKTALEQERPLLALRPPRSETKAFHGFEALLDLGATSASSVEDATRQAATLWAEQAA
jgi:DNA protecting protein DprA